MNSLEELFLSLEKCKLPLIVIIPILDGLLFDSTNSSAAVECLYF
jgi:hypothetical protein